MPLLHHRGKIIIIEMKQNDINFVARHYRRGAFSPEAAWRRLGLAAPRRWTRMKVAAVVALTVVVGATAALLINSYQPHTGNVPAIEMPAATEGSMTAVRAIDFENAPLTEIVAAIKDVYGVEISGLPDGVATERLTLHFEGNVTDLIETINDLLGTEMFIEEK